MDNKPQAHVKKYELAYRAWLKRLFKTFGKFLLSNIDRAIAEDKSLSPELVEYFYKRINFDPINKTYFGILKQNEKFFEKLIKDIPKRREQNKIKLGLIEKLVQESLPQRMLFNSFQQEDILKKKQNFFELETTIIQSELVKQFEVRKNQLDSFRQSFLFNDEKKAEIFKEKYPEPTYKFTDSMGRTETNNLNRDLSAILATNMGSKKFEWLTSQDERVRESHKELNGKIFEYSDMPKEYNDYNCRCTLLPVLDSIEGLI